MVPERYNDIVLNKGTLLQVSLALRTSYTLRREEGGGEGPYTRSKGKNRHFTIRNEMKRKAMSQILTGIIIMTMSSKMF